MKTFLVLAIVAHAQETSFTSKTYVENMFPFPEGITRLNIHQSKEPEGIRIYSDSLPCPDKHIYAATPGQYTKDYFSDISFMFDAHKIPGDRKGSPRDKNKAGVLTENENACKIPANKSASRRPDGSIRCVMGKFGRYLLISDFFQDKCGNTYRGFWENAYLLENFGNKNPMRNSAEEHTGTSSIGRNDNMYPNTDGTSMEFEAGGTTPVERSRFLFFIKTSESDMNIIRKTLSEQAGDKSVYVRCKDGSFEVRSRGCKGS